MTSDDQHFLDMLSSIPNDVKKYSLELADAIDRQIDLVAATLRDSLSHQSWLPQSIRPPPQPNVPSARVRGPPPSLLDRAQDWVLAHRAWTAAFIAFVGTGGFLVYRQRKLYGKRRRARKAGNGSRKEIVVIASSPHEPMARSIAHDLERRGFIVFMTVTSPEEAQIVLSDGKPDLRPLYVDVTSSTPSPNDVHPSLNQIHTLLTQPQYPSPGSQPHTCHLSGLILIPSPSFPVGPLATIQPSTWADTINARLLTPVLIAQMFLPLLTSSKHNRSAVLLLTPTVASTLSAPCHGPEALVVRGLEGWASTLERELRVFSKTNQDDRGSVDVVQLRLGRVDLEPSFNRGKSTELQSYRQSSPHVLPVPILRRHPSGQSQGSPARLLHNAVFDAVAMSSASSKIWQRRSRVVYVGKGSFIYPFLARWAPDGLVGWMLGFGLRRGFVGTGEESWGSESWEKV